MQEKNNKLFITFVNSTVMYILLYIAYYIAYQFITAYIASINDLDAVIRYYETKTVPYDNYWWNKKRPIIYTYSMGPLFCLVTGLIFRILHQKYFYKWRGPLKMFSLWGYLHGFNFFFGGLVIGIILGQGFGHAILWTYMPYAFMLIIAGLSLMVLIFFGFKSTVPFLQTSITKDMIERDSGERLKYIFAVALAPFIVGNTFIYLLKYPENSMLDISQWLTMIPILLPVLSFANYPKRVTLAKDHDFIPVHWRYVIVCIAILLVYRIGLSSEIRFEAEARKLKEQKK